MIRDKKALKEELKIFLEEGYSLSEISQYLERTVSKLKEWCKEDYTLHELLKKNLAKTGSSSRLVEEKPPPSMDVAFPQRPIPPPLPSTQRCVAPFPLFLEDSKKSMVVQFQQHMPELRPLKNKPIPIPSEILPVVQRLLTEGKDAKSIAALLDLSYEKVLNVAYSMNINLIRGGKRIGSHAGRIRDLVEEGTSFVDIAQEVHLHVNTVHSTVIRLAEELGQEWFVKCQRARELVKKEKKGQVLDLIL